MARPRLTERRDDRLNPRLTAAERMTIEANAAFYGLTPSDYMRRRALEHRMPASKSDQRQQAVEATGLIRLANNLNQLTHHANAGTVLERELVAIMERINTCLDQLYDPGPG